VRIEDCDAERFDESFRHGESVGRVVLAVG